MLTNEDVPWSTVGYLVAKRCVHKDTRILDGNFQWVPAHTLRVGDTIFAFDEEPTGSRQKRRRLKFAKVEHNEIEPAKCVGVLLEDGTTIYCTPDHSWLVGMSGTELEWREAKDLLKTKKNGPVYLPRVFGSMWEDPSTYESSANGYIAGAFDGEGCLDRTNSVTFTQVGNEMLAKMEHLLSSKGFSFTKKQKSKYSSVKYKSERQDCFDLRILGIKAILNILAGTGSVRLLRKLRQNLEKRTGDSGQVMQCHPEDWVRVVDVFDAGVMDVCVMQTSSKTHFTEGFPSHNTYARRLNDSDPDSPTEEWSDIVDRVLDASQNQLGVGFTDDELARLRTYMMKLKGTVAGRFLWQLGTPTVDRLGLPSLQNCAFTTVDDPVRPFTWAYDMLMLGSGVGYNVQREYVYKLPPVRDGFKRATRQDDASADFIVPDSREGWVALLDRLLRSAFYEDVPYGFTFSTQLVRGKGAPIKGFGGTASGPEEMCRGLDLIGGILESRAGKQLRPIDCLDIMNLLGMIVVSGNVRRSAQIAIGDCDDLQYLKAKDWSSGNIPNWRAYSNNSVVCNDFSLLPEAFWDTYNGLSEPYGLINLKLSQSCGRLGETQYKDKQVRGYNPCAEQSLADFETCCLAEIFLPNIESKEELLDVATLLYRINKHSLALPCHHKETEAIVHKNMRMGIGLTGVLQCPEKLEWASWVYPKLRQFDKEYSKQHGWPTSIKLTTMKPSGTLSLLPGVTPGIHPAFAQYMIRRIRIAANHPLVDTCRSHGYHTEYMKNFDGSLDFGTVVVEFPFAHPEGTVLAEQLSAIDQLEWVKKAQTLWSDNSVSCTVYYTKEELPKIREYLANNYNQNFKSLSFLLREDHGFVQAPLEAISKERYDELVANTKVITSIGNVEFDGETECAGGVCPVR